jgi:hypothetical protein
MPYNKLQHKNKRTNIQKKKLKVEACYHIQKEHFLAIIVHMGSVRKPKLRNYWSTNPIYDSKFASSLHISQDHFFTMLTFLHLNNDTYIPGGNTGHDHIA